MRGNGPRKALGAKIDETPSRPAFTVGAEKEILMKKHTNGAVLPSVVLVPPGAERSEAEAVVGDSAGGGRQRREQLMTADLQAVAGVRARRRL